MKRGKVISLAREQGVTVAQLLRELYAEHGNQTAVAAHIGISQGRLSQIIKQYGLAERAVLVELEAS